MNRDEVHVLLPDDDALALLAEVPGDVRISVWDGTGQPPRSIGDVTFYVPALGAGDERSM